MKTQITKKEKSRISKIVDDAWDNDKDGWEITLEEIGYKDQKLQICPLCKYCCVEEGEDDHNNSVPYCYLVFEDYGAAPEVGYGGKCKYFKERKKT